MADLKLSILMEAADKISGPFRRAGQSTDTLRTALKDATAKVRGLEKTSGDIEAFARLKSEAKANATALDAAQEKAQALGRALGNDGGTKKARTAFAKARAEVDRLKAAQAANTRETATMRRRLGEAGVDTRRLSTAQRTLKRDLDAARQAAERQAKALDTARAKTKALAAARTKLDRALGLQSKMAVGGAAGMAMGGGALALGGRMAGAGISFGEQMSAVGAVARLDKTSAEFKQLSDLAQTLGASTSFSASEAAGGLQKLAMAGFSTNQMLAAMPGVLDLAKAGGADLAMTADIATNTLSAFGLKASEMGRVGDVMTATFTRSNVDLQMLSDTMKYTGPIAAQFGASVEDVAAMTGLLGNIGIQGGQAGTALRALFTRMASPPKDALNMLMELGVATQDASGNARAMTDILADVAKATNGMGGAQRLAAFTAIAGQEAGASMAELVTKGGEGAITKFVEILNTAKGESARVAKAMGDNAAGDLKGFSSAVEGLNIALTETNDAPLRSLIQSATEVVRGITGWVKENPKLAGTLVKVGAGLAGVVFVGGLLATTVAGLLGPFAMARFALTAIGIQGGFAAGALGLLKGGFGLLSTAAGTLFPMMMTGIKALGAAFMTNPIGLALMAIAGAVALVITYWEPIKGFFADLWGDVGGSFTGAWDVVKKVLGFSPLGLIINHWESITEFFGGLLDGIVGMFGKAWDWILGKIKTLAAPMEWLTEKLGGLFGGDENTVNVRHERAPMKIASTATAAALAAPLAAASPAPAPAHFDMGGVTIHIQAAQGQDANDIGKAVRRELEKMMAEKERAGRSRLYDEVD